jgi:hydroxymethylpyrimidine pyrophosphatase-like HAD family hydrolase
MDWTILNKGNCDIKTKEILDNLSTSKITVVLTTWKWLPRIDSSFQTEQYEYKILENWSRILLPWQQQLFDSIEWEHLIALNEIFEQIKQKVSFMFFYSMNRDNQFWIFYIQDFSHNKLQKFWGIMTPENTFHVTEFPKYLKAWNWITMLNICVNALSLKELWLPDTYKGLNLVFNEWMLNISVSDKWTWIEKILDKTPKKISHVLVAGNDVNDIPAFNKADELSWHPMIEKTWIIVVGDMISENLLRKDTKTTIYRVSSPEEISLPIMDFFSL